MAQITIMYIIIADLEPVISKRRLVEGVYQIERSLYKEITGVDANCAQLCAALVDIQRASRILYEEGADDEELRSGESLAVRQERSEVNASYEGLPRRVFWAPDCVFGVDNDARADRVCAPLLILEDVRSADNIGVILRTAFTLGLRSIIVTRTSFAGIGCRAARVSMGALFFFSIYETEDLVATVETLKSQGICVIGTSPRGSHVVGTNKREDTRWALVVGNEERGCSSELMAACSRLDVIPQASGDSLSVSVACGICLFDLLSNRLVSTFMAANPPEDC